MWKEQEGYLLYEPDQDTLVVSEHIEIHNMQKTAGILPVHSVEKDGIELFLWEHQGLVELSECIGDLNQKRFVQVLLSVLEVLQEVRAQDVRNLEKIVLDPKYIYMDPYTDQIYLIQLPIPEPMQSHIGWESRLKTLFQDLLGKNSISGMDFAQSMQILLRGKIAAPENLGRNLHIIAQKRIYGFTYQKRARQRRIQPYENPQIREAFEELWSITEKTESQKSQKNSLQQETNRKADSESDRKPELRPEVREETKSEIKPEQIQEQEVSQHTERFHQKLLSDQTAATVEKKKEKKQSGIFFRKKKEKEEKPVSEPPKIQEVQPQKSVTENPNTNINSNTSANSNPNTMQQDQVQILQNARSRKQDTQVLRQNIWNSISGAPGSGGFASVAPVKLGGQNGSTGNSQGLQREKMGNELHFVSFDGTGRVDFLINKSYFVIGKMASQVDGVISYTPTISRAHCAIQLEGSEVYLEDLGSSNHTFVNDRELTPYERVRITPKDNIRLAKERFAILYR
ncbi:FHA domain-containing protein [Ruminococcus sp. MCC718]|uniref:FHA domain-containing protein n=1 Tax=Ruminococcus sp. MCC718 TaxID=2592649 RepID=UPI001C02C3E7|nr:FHA domain-containing protein [Ruminococcus sp. MCC718]MBT9651473.1 FHA domain-containing protein [Ruminococcus sp. MCC718]